MIGVFIRMKAAPLVLLQRSMMLNDHVLANLFNDEGSHMCFQILPPSTPFFIILAEESQQAAGLAQHCWAIPTSTKIPANP